MASAAAAGEEAVTEGIKLPELNHISAARWIVTLVFGVGHPCPAVLAINHNLAESAELSDKAAAGADS